MAACVKATALTPLATNEEIMVFSPNAKGIVAQASPPNVPVLAKPKRRYHLQRPHDWRTRLEPFVDLWEEIHATLQPHPDRTGVAIFAELQQRYPGRFPDCQVRTLQRGIGKWRAQVLLTFAERQSIVTTTGELCIAPALHLEPLSSAG
jgi:hypothetical protein